ncbi:topoisomerase I [Myriangium duriaei CBS 260.36]|uniref:DNA topoisomerase I n=1 Tax=Myriangium duriaei CBS 260.36 TaxID=1168546 RepID=A0A9P4J7L0_9PEZI|nr:topoisomerase I [Myriangium duriaei CBS 260.36]
MPQSSSDENTPFIKKSKPDAIQNMKGSRVGHTESGVVLAANITNGANGQTNGTQKRKASMGKSYQQASDSDDEPMSKRQRRTSTKAGAAASEDDDDVPLSKAKRVSRPSIRDDSDSDDAPLTSRLSEAKAQKLQQEKHRIEAKAEKQANGVKKEESDSDAPLSKKAPLAKAASAKSTPAKAAPAKKGKAVKSESATPARNLKKEATAEADGEEDDEEQYKWWQNEAKGDGTKKWDTLQHNGVVFPPDYEPLPKNVKMRYDGVPVTLPPESEEVAGFYGAMLNSTVNVGNPTFNKNFFNDFKDILDRTGHGKGPNGEKVKITKFDKCDFKPIFEYYDAERERKKARPAAEKKADKAAKDEVEAPYTHCLWDGRKQKVGNFRVEPPGLFRGRGEHPKTGKLKQRVQPEQVTINIGKEATVPTPPEGHRWKEIKHDQEGTWLAMWQENINGNYKYVMLAASSDIKGQSDHKKFEKARELKKHIGRIRKDYQKSLKSELMADRQLATAVYLIDQYALRAGNEKGDDEADTVGCCSLKFEHITLEPPNKVIFDFLGKDSIRFHEEFMVDQQVFKNLKIFKKAPKKAGDEIFDRLTTSGLNKHLSSYMPGLTAKVFRTYNASQTFANLLKELKPGNGTIQEKMKDYNDANRKVAILCNHKRTVAAGHGAQMEKLQDKIDGVRYQQYRTKRMMLELEPKLKKRRGAEYFELPDGLDREWQQAHHKFLVEQEQEKIRKKFAKDNEKRAAEGEKEMKNRELDERLEVADELQKKLARELKTGKVEVEGKGMTVEKLEEKVDKFQVRIDTMTVQGEDKKNTSDVALGTSKTNYIDPRLTVVFAKKFDVPIEKLFSATLRAKFQWAIESTEEDWEF